VPIALCGELAGRQETMPQLLRLGFRSLSMAPRLIPGAKELIRGVRLGERRAASEARRGARSGAVGSRALPRNLAVDEVTDQLDHLVSLALQGEVAGIEEVKLNVDRSRLIDP